MNDLLKIPCGTVKLDIPMDIICNGFSIKETIKEVLQESCLYAPTPEDRDFEINEIADAIKEAFAIKLRMKQG